MHLFRAVCFTAAALLSTTRAVAADGDFDTSFGPNGNGTHDFLLQSSSLPGVANGLRAVVEVPGRTVFEAPRYWVMASHTPDPLTGVSAAVASARFLANGILDSNYGPAGNGTAVTAVNMDAVFALRYARWQRGSGPTLTTFDRIFALGSANMGSRVLRLCSITPNAQLDLSFTGAGCATYRFEDFGASATGAPFAVLSEGDRVYLVADRLGAGGIRSVGVLRVFAETGAIDTSYGFGGYASVSFAGVGVAFRVLAALDRDSRMVVAASYGSGGAEFFGFARLNAQGAVDASFCADPSLCNGTGSFQHVLSSAQLGIPSSASLRALSLGPNRIFLSAETAQSPARTAILALRADGAQARDFGSGGVLRLAPQLPAQQFSSNPAMLATRRGRLFVAGLTQPNNSTVPLQSLYTRLTRSGSCDADFAGPCPRQLPANSPRIVDIALDGADRPLLLTDNQPDGSVRLIRLEAQRDLLDDGFE